jgi:hypothetical protein
MWASLGRSGNAARVLHGCYTLGRSVNGDSDGHSDDIGGNCCGGDVEGDGNGGFICTP